MEGLARAAVRTAEAGKIPDSAICLGMNIVISSRRRAEEKRTPSWRLSLREAFWSGPIAINTVEANGRHHEVFATSGG